MDVWLVVECVQVVIEWIPGEESVWSVGFVDEQLLVFENMSPQRDSVLLYLLNDPTLLYCWECL